MKKLNFGQVSLLMVFIMLFVVACEDLPSDVDDFDFPSIDSTDIEIDSTDIGIDSTDIDFPGVDDCYCLTVFEPVCAAGITFSNACVAECAGFTTYEDGECDYPTDTNYDTIDCFCPLNLAPVCADGITFPNACVAECEGYTTYEDGECP
ncbi:MAG: Kazal-type serine protease inhibitor family protein [Chitinophagales bacterium]